MMLAPDSTNLIAPRSARSLGIMSGYCSTVGQLYISTGSSSTGPAAQGHHTGMLSMHKHTPEATGGRCRGVASAPGAAGAAWGTRDRLSWKRTAAFCAAQPTGRARGCSVAGGAAAGEQAVGVQAKHGLSTNRLLCGQLMAALTLATLQPMHACVLLPSGVAVERPNAHTSQRQHQHQRRCSSSKRQWLTA
jgi:hypothetical protein